MSVSQKLLRIGDKRAVAYKNLAGNKSPGVIYVPGYKSNMETSKALALEEFCVKNGNPFVRFDYEGCGESPGEFSEQTLSVWKEDLLSVLDGLTDGPQLLVGSSMGGWLSCLLAMERPERVHGLVGICPANNFIRELEKKLVVQPNSDGEITLTGPNDEHFMFSNCLVEDSDKHAIDLNSPIPIRCGVRLIHGLRDETVPFETSVKIMQQLESKDAELIVRKSGTHRMHEPRDIAIIIEALKSLL